MAVGEIAYILDKRRQRVREVSNNKVWKKMNKMAKSMKIDSSKVYKKNFVGS
jgi:hypothetical protein